MELAEAARAFLVAAFQRADRDADGALSPSDCDELFSTAPAACAAVLGVPLSAAWVPAHACLRQDAAASPSASPEAQGGCLLCPLLGLAAAFACACGTAARRHAGTALRLSGRLVTPHDGVSAVVARRPWRRASAGGPLVEERPGGLLPLRAWLALWAALAAASPRKCLEHLLLLGYAGEPGALLAPSRPRRAERSLPNGPARGVFQVPSAYAPGCFAGHAAGMKR